MQVHGASERTPPFQFPIALSVGGTPASDPDLASKAIKAYTELLAGAPKKLDAESETLHKTKLDKWSSDMSRSSTWSTVVNACMLSWESPNGP